MTLHSPSFSSRVFLCVCHAAVSLIPNWKEEHAQIKSQKKPPWKAYLWMLFCVLWHWSIENRNTAFDFLISEVDKRNIGIRPICFDGKFDLARKTSIVFWKNAKSKLAFGKKLSENAKFWWDSDWRVKKRCVKLHKNLIKPIWLTWIIVTLIRSRNKFSESFFFSFLNDLGAKNFKKMSYYLSLLVFFWLGFSGKVTFGRLAWTNIQTSVSRGMYLI